LEQFPEDGGKFSLLSSGSLSEINAATQLAAARSKQGTALRQISEWLMLLLLNFNFSFTCSSSA